MVVNAGLVLHVDVHAGLVLHVDVHAGFVLHVDIHAGLVIYMFDVLLVMYSSFVYLRMYLLDSVF